MRHQRWLFKTAFKYLSTQKSAFSIILISIIGITLGVSVLIFILSVMNGSQLIFYENSQEILSYHLQITADTDWNGVKAYAEKVKADIPEILSAVVFFESQGLLVNSNGKQFFTLLRGAEPDVLEQDPRLKHYLTAYHHGRLKSGEFDLRQPNCLVVGSDIARALSVAAGSPLSFYSLTSAPVERKEDLRLAFVTSGVYETEWNAGVDSLLSFAPLALYPKLAQGSPFQIGIKLKNSNLDRLTEHKIKALGLPEGWKVSSWRDYNRSFFSALRMEKTTMLLLVALVFLVFAVNTANALSRLIYDKQDELGMLRAMGATPAQVRLIFIYQGFWIALFGTFFGTGIGLLITGNLAAIHNAFFALKESLISFFRPDSYFPYSPLNSQFAQPRILLGDLAVIDLLAMVITVAAAFFASVSIGKIKPAEVLKDE